MSAPARRLIAPFLLAASFAQSALGQVPGGRDVVGAARDLYASARYDEALAVLNDLRPADDRRAPCRTASRSSSTGRSACWRSGAAAKRRARSRRS